MPRKNTFEAKLKKLCKASDKPIIENISSDSDDSTKEFNVTLPRRTNTRKSTAVKRKCKSAKSAVKFRKISESSTPLKIDAGLPLQNRKLFASDDNKTPPKKTFIQDDKKPGTSKEYKTPPVHSKINKSIIENVTSSDDEVLDFSPLKKLLKPTIENIDDLSPVTIPATSSSNATDEENDDTPKISQVSSEHNSQIHRFNAANIHNVKVKEGGSVETLLKALSESQHENIQWDCDTKTPNSQTKYFTVSHFEKVLGSIMIFFMLEDQKSAIFLEPTNKIVKKLKVGNFFAFCPDYEPYKMENGVDVYTGVTKIKLMH